MKIHYFQISLLYRQIVSWL